MAMTVKRRKDTSVKKVIQHRVADIRGGVGVITSNLGGSVLLEGTPLGAPVNGKVEVVKLAKVVTNAGDSATSYEVEKGHHFKVGDFVMLKEGGVAAAITGINKSNASKDVINVEETLGEAVTAGDYLMEAAEASSNASALKVEPHSINGTTQEVVPNDNLFTDAWVIAVTKDTLPAAILDKLKGIIQY